MMVAFGTRSAANSLCGGSRGGRSRLLLGGNRLSLFLRLQPAGQFGNRRFEGLDALFVGLAAGLPALSCCRSS